MENQPNAEVMAFIAQQVALHTQGLNDQVVALQGQLDAAQDLILQLQQPPPAPPGPPPAPPAPPPNVPAHAFAPIPAAPVGAPGNAGGAKLSKPEEFHGEAKHFRSFVAQCRVYINGNLASFPTERDKCLWVISYLKGDAFLWVESITRSLADPTIPSAPELDDLNTLFRYLHGAYGAVDERQQAATDLQHPKPAQSVAAYAPAFRGNMVCADWGNNQQVYMDHFRANLRFEIKQKLIGRRFANLQELIQAAIEMDEEFRQLRTSQKNLSGSGLSLRTPVTVSVSAPTPSAPAPTRSRDPNAMEVDTARQAERDRRRRLGLCFRCGESGHISPNCPKKSSPGSHRAAATNSGEGTSSGTTPMTPESSGTPSGSVEINALKSEVSSLAALVKSLIDKATEQDFA